MVKALSKQHRRYIALASIAITLCVLVALGRYYLTLDTLRDNRVALLLAVSNQPTRTALLFSALYIIVAALSIPGATVLTLGAGALFGLFRGVVIVSVASTIGATLAFLISRYLFRVRVQAWGGSRLNAINNGINREGAFYLFGLRLVPAFPFFMVNLAMGLTPIPVRTFIWVSQLGMLPGTIVYVNAGTELSKLHSLSGILSGSLILSFSLLGTLPLITKRILQIVRSVKHVRAYPRPQSFDYNVVVIGAGSAGLVTAYIAAAVKAKVALIEKHRMGGDCLNTGCVPSKALIRTAKFLFQAKHSENYGVDETAVTFNFAAAMDRVHRIISEVAPHDSVERYSKLGVECIAGTATIQSPFEVAVDGRILTTRSIVIATGARPRIPAIPGIHDVDFLTSDTVWDIRELPKRFVIVGGGPIGCELAQCFQRLGSQVTIIETNGRLLHREDEDVSDLIQRQFGDEGIQILTDVSDLQITTEEREHCLQYRKSGSDCSVLFDKILVAVGRTPVVTGLGLEALNVEVTKNGALETDEFLTTSIPNIYVAGDIVGSYQFTHVAAHQAWFAAINALFSPFKRSKVDYQVIPRCTFTDPEVARVGLSETEAIAKKIDYRVTKYELADLDRAIADSSNYGFVKVLTPKRGDKILGATIVGDHAGDLLTEFVTAMKHGFGLNKILSTIHTYPTMAEANKYVAGQWRRENTSPRVLALLERYHTWRR